MVERRKGPDSCLEQGIDKPVIVIQATLVDLPHAAFEHTRPRNRKAIASQAEP